MLPFLAGNLEHLLMNLVDIFSKSDILNKINISNKDSVANSNQKHC